MRGREGGGDKGETGVAGDRVQHYQQGVRGCEQ